MQSLVKKLKGYGTLAWDVSVLAQNMFHVMLVVMRFSAFLGSARMASQVVSYNIYIPEV